MKIDGWKTILSLFLADIHEFVGRVHLQKETHRDFFVFFITWKTPLLIISINFTPKTSN